MNHWSIVTRKVATVFLFVFFASNLSLFAQGNKTAPDPGGYWLAYTGDNKINSRIGIHSEVQLRNFFLPHTVSTFLVRTGLNFYIKPFAMATVGYGYFYNDPSSDEVIGSRASENRIWQQLVLRQKTTFIFMEHRYRMEQRFIHNVTNKTDQIDYRIRYRFQTLYPLYSVSPHLRHLFVSMNNEIMINFKREPARVFDRNRFFAGLGYQVSPKMNFQLGYLNQFINIPGKATGQTDHIVQFAVAYNMDDLMQSFFTKKQDK